MYNSKTLMVQVSLSGEDIPKMKFKVLAIVSIDVIGLTKNVWFRMLDSEQIDSVESSCQN